MVRWGFHHIGYSWLFAFVLVVLLFAFIFYERKKKHMQLWSKDCLRLSRMESIKLWLLRHFFLIGALCFLTLALMEPFQKRLQVVAPVSSFEKVPHRVNFIFDTSLSMSAADMAEGVSRFQAAKQLIRSVVSKLDDQFVRLISFNKQSEVVIPQTQDRFFFNIMVDELSFEDLPTQGTDVLQMLDFVNKSIYDDEFKQKETIILLTDGGDLFLEDKNDQERLEALNLQINALKTSQENAQVYIVGVGSSLGASIPNASYQGKKVHVTLNDRLLNDLAVSWSAQYYRLVDYTNRALTSILVENIAKDDAGELVKTQIKERVVRSYQFLIICLSLLSILAEILCRASFKQGKEDG